MDRGCTQTSEKEGYILDLAKNGSEFFSCQCHHNKMEDGINAYLLTGIAERSE